MAIEIKKQKRSNALSYFLIILVLFLIGWIGWSFFKPGEIFQKPNIENLLPSSSQELIEVKLDIGIILNNPVFQTLSPHITWPLDVPDLGRANPFKTL